MQRLRRERVVLVRTLIISSTRYPSEYTRNCLLNAPKSHILAPKCSSLPLLLPLFTCQRNRPRETIGYNSCPKVNRIPNLHMLRNIFSAWNCPGTPGSPKLRHAPYPYRRQESSDFGGVNRPFDNNPTTVVTYSNVLMLMLMLSFHSSVRSVSANWYCNCDLPCGCMGALPAASVDLGYIDAFRVSGICMRNWV